LEKNIIDFTQCYTDKRGKKMYEQIIIELEEKRARNEDFSLSDAEKIAAQILTMTPDYVGTDFTPIVKISQNFGFHTYKTDLNDKNNKAWNATERDDSHRKLMGNIFVGGKETEEAFEHDKVIVVDEKESLFQQRFVTAHELAHYLFECVGNHIFRDKQYQAAYFENNHNTPEERLANRFAACILMPRKLFISKYNYAREVVDNRLFAITYLSKFFKTSTASIELRIKEVLEDV